MILTATDFSYDATDFSYDSRTILVQIVLFSKIFDNCLIKYNMQQYRLIIVACFQMQISQLKTIWVVMHILAWWQERILPW